MSDRRKISDQVKEDMATLRERGLSCNQIALKIKMRHGLDLSEGAISYQCLLVGADTPRLAKKVLPQTSRGPAVYMRHGRQVRKFQPHEDALLRGMPPERGAVSAMARRLGRSPNSIRTRLAILARHDARREAAFGVAA